MYAEIVRQGSMTRTKTYTVTASEPDASTVHWDQSNDNNMNDDIATITTQAGTWVWVFQDTNFNTYDTNVIVPPEQSWNMSEMGFSCKLGSFKVCDSDPNPAPAVAPTPISTYYQIRDIPALPANQRYLLLVANSYTQAYLQPLACINSGLVLDATVYSSIEIPDASTIASDLSMYYQWQFFAASDGTYVIANCGTGELISPTTTVTSNGTSMTLGTDVDTCAAYAITQYQGTDGNWSGVVSLRDVTGAGDTYLTVGSGANNSVLWESMGTAVGACQWYLMPYSTFELPSLENTTNLSLPSFDNGTAPPKYPFTPELSNAVYVPYFMVNDRTMKNWANRIAYSPYYRLNQYWQFKLAASLMNNTDGQDIFNESWTYGWSVNLSATVNASLGFTLGGQIVENQFLFKEKEEASINAQLGISATVGATGSGSYSKNVSIYVQARTCAAFYGVETTYQLYQMIGNSCVATPGVPMKMDNNFLTITGPIPTDSNSPASEA